MEKGKCRGCGADILWATTESGSKIPLDTKPEKRFRPMTRGAITPHEIAVLVDTYQSHFATCPKAGDFRKPKAQRPQSGERVDE